MSIAAPGLRDGFATLYENMPHEKFWVPMQAFPLTSCVDGVRPFYISVSNVVFIVSYSLGIPKEKKSKVWNLSFIFVHAFISIQ